MLRTKIVAALLLIYSGSSFAAIASKPGAYDVTHEPFKLGREIHVTYVRPAQPRHDGYLVMFVTGDGGWRSVSSDVFEHLADQGYWLAGFSAPEIVKPIKRMGEHGAAAERVKASFAEAKLELGLPDSTPIIVIGFSRGATFVAFSALHPDLRDGVAGAVAIALTREADYLRAPPAERASSVQIDDKGRIQIYPALKQLGSTPLAVIQSTNDGYVPAAEARELLGPDTPTLRLYTVEAKNHGFGGGRDALLHDLDDALSWIEQGPGSVAKE